MPRPVKGAKLIGGPYQGTHSKAFNQAGGSDNWESENAVDLAVPVGTPIYAVANGTIGPQFGAQGGGRFAGLRLHLNTANGLDFFYGHLSKFAPGLKPGSKVRAGQLLGYSGSANGVAHLHFAMNRGNPEKFINEGGQLPASGDTAAPAGSVTPSSSPAQAPPADTVSTQPDLTIPQYTPPGGPPDPASALPGLSMPPGSVQAGGFNTAQAWQMIASQQLASPESQQIAARVTGGQ